MKKEIKTTSKKEMTRSEVIEDLPIHLKSLSIVDIIPQQEASSSIINRTEEVYLDWFASERFRSLNAEDRKKATWEYQLLMQTLRRLEEFEYRTINKA